MIVQRSGNIYGSGRLTFVSHIKRRRKKETFMFLPDERQSAAAGYHQSTVLNLPTENY
jgi:hypothetical protein